MLCSRAKPALAQFIQGPRAVQARTIKVYLLGELLLFQRAPLKRLENIALDAGQHDGILLDVRQHDGLRVPNAGAP